MTTQNTGVRDEILKGNIELHRIEAPHYDALHPEEFNWFEQGNIRRDILRITGSLPKPASALDIGCGTGNIMLKLLANGLNVHGVDISKEMADALGARIPASLKDNAHISVKNIDEFLGGCNEEFDLITISSVLHHLPDYLSSLETIVNKIKPRGWMYITHEPTKNSLGADPFLRKVLWQIDSLVYGILREPAVPKTEARNYRISDYHLYRGFDEEKVLEVCKASGLEVVSFRRYSSSMRMGLSCWVDSKLLNSKRNFSLIARKGME